MGWSSIHRPRGFTTREFLQRELWGPDSGYRILDLAGKSGVKYAAIETPAGEVVGAVILVRYGGSRYDNFSFKTMSEDMGPYYYDCPGRILDRLTPTQEKYALEWREECRKQGGY